MTSISSVRMALDNPRPTAYSWSDICETATNLEKLRLLCNDPQALRREGYVTKPLTSEQLLSKLRCKNCGNRMRPPHPTIPSTLQQPDDSHNAEHVDVDASQKVNQRLRKRNMCEFHPGRVHNLHFTCCQAHVSIQKGCHVDPQHTAPEHYEQALRLNWFYYETSTTVGAASGLPKNNRKLRATSHPTRRVARAAIALDCEFGVSIYNEPELIRITAIDFFSKQVLIDSLVKPATIIKNYSTRYSGVTSAAMREAVRSRSCIFGRDDARKKLLEFVDARTMIVVHGGSSDMSSLRWVHPNIVDTCILETYGEPLQGGRSLKNLCEKKFDLRIQMGKKGHDSKEDALACRELAIWMMNMIPDA